MYINIKYSSNILLDEYRRAKVCDFGLARYLPQLPPDKSYVSVDSFRGTRAYAPDEYLDGQLGPKVDVYSLGVVSKYCKIISDLLCKRNISYFHIIIGTC